MSLDSRLERSRCPWPLAGFSLSQPQAFQSAFWPLALLARDLVGFSRAPCQGSFL